MADRRARPAAQASNPTGLDPVAAWFSNDSDRTFSIAWGDMDGDGDFDLATGNANGPNKVYLNIGGMVSATAVFISADNDDTSSVAWGDMDGDGDLDLAAGNEQTWDGQCGCYVGGEDNIYLNTGGILQPTPVFTSNSSDSTTSVAWGDMDGDGDLDLVTGNNGDPTKIYLNTGGVLNPAPVFSSDDAHNTTSIAWGDMDGDGDLDLAVGNSYQPNNVYLNIGGILQSTPVFSSSNSYGTRSVAWGDMDGDGDLDLAIGETYKTYVYLNTGGMLETLPSFTSSDSYGIRSVAWGDMDGDGDLDLAVGRFESPNNIYQNVGGMLQPSPVFTASNSDRTFDVDWGDMDGDGDLDLAVANENQPNQIYQNSPGLLQATPGFTSAMYYSAYTYGIAWGDMDSDGDLDLAVGNANQSNHVYLNAGGSLQPVPVFSSSDSDFTWSVAWGDMDGDGDLDLAAGNDNQNNVYLNADGMLQSTPVFTSSDSKTTWSVAWGDMDGDGDLDLAAGNFYQPNNVYLNVGGTLQATPVFTSNDNDGTRSVAWGDMDGDGDLDLAAGNYGQPNKIYRNVSGMLQPNAVWTSSDINWTYSVAWGDMDSDGDLDLATGNYGQPNRVYMNIDGRLQSAAGWASSDNDYTRSISWGDGDGDGDLDLAAGNYGQPSKVYLNVGGLLEPTPGWTSDIGDAQSVAWGDVDNDGDLDLAVGYWDYSSQSVRLYLNQRAAHPLHPGRTAHASIAFVSGPVLAFSQTVTTLAPAGFYAVPQIRRGVIPITYTLSSPDGQPMRFIRAYYSPDGGGKWYTATAASGTITQERALPGYGVALDGVDDYINRNLLSGLTTGNTPHTIEAWVKANRPPAIRSWPLLLGDANNGAHHWLLNNNGVMQIGVWDGGQVQPILPTGQWTHIAAAFDGTTLTVYVNGELAGSVAATFNLQGLPLRVGWPSDVENYFNGQVDEVRVWNHARSQAEIQAFMAQTVAGTASGLVLYWRLDEGSGATADDLTDNANDGSLENGPLWSTGALVEALPTLGSALAFDGVNDYLHVGGANTLAFPGNTPFSIEAWVKPKVGGGGGVIVGKQNTGVSGDYLLWLTPDGRVQLYREVAPWGVASSSASAVPFGQWSHVVGMYDGATMSVYVNGVLAGSLASGVKGSGTSPVLIGASLDNNTPTNFFNGIIDEVRLWSVARTEAQIQANMGRTLTETVPWLVGYWRLDEGQGLVASDRTPNYYHETLGGGAVTNMPTWTTGMGLTHLPTKSATLPFDGVDDYVIRSNLSGLSSGNSAHTVEAWVKVNQIPTVRSWPILLGDYASGSHHWTFNNDGRLYMGVYGFAGQQISSTLPISQWTHLAASFNGATLTVYQNGILIGSVPATFNLQGLPLRLGLPLCCSENYFPGQISEVRVWNVVRSQAEIQGAMGQRLQGDETSLVAYWRLNEGGGTTANDLTNNNNDGTIWNSPLWLLGSQWTPARPHVFNWDVNASGFFGSSDNVIFRIEAYPSLSSRANGTPVFQRPYASSTTFPFRVRGTQVQVLSGTQAISNAVVYRLPVSATVGGALIGNATAPFHTDNNGYLQGRGELKTNDRLLALVPITWTDSYTLYYTNGTPNDAGLAAYTMTTSGVQQLTVSSAKPLYLFNLNVALEWDASHDPSYLDQLKFNLQQTSDYLYDFTNGQAALGQVNVFQNADNWAYAHLVVHATNRLRPYAVIGGVVSTYTQEVVGPLSTGLTSTLYYGPGQLHIGATWNRYGNPGQSLGQDWSLILAHELSHYLFYLDDTYLGLTPQGQLQAISSCKGSAMGDLYADAAASEFIFNPTLWQNTCANTLAALTQGRAEWATLRAHYPALITPTAVLTGPSQVPYAFTTINIAPLTATNALADPTFFLDYTDGRASSTEARAFLLRDGQYIYDLGSPFGGQNRVIGRGAKPGDRLCIFDRAWAQFGCEPVADGDDRVQMKADPTWMPLVQVRPVNSTTFNVQVGGLTSTLSLSARLYPEYGAATLTQTLTFIGNIYSGTLTSLAPALAGQVQVWVNESYSEDNPRRETVVAYSVGGNPGNSLMQGGSLTRGGGGNSLAQGGGNSLAQGGGSLRGGSGNSLAQGGGNLVASGGGPVLSPDGQMTFFVADAITLSVGQFYAIQSLAGLPDPPAGRVVIGTGYSLVASPGTPVLTGSVSVQYLANDVLVAGADEGDLSWYFHNGSVWRELPTDVNEYFNLATAEGQGVGLYALMASIKIPFYGTGWNNVAYPIHETRPVTDALASIAGKYTTVYGYVMTDTVQPWRIHYTLWPSALDTLHQLEFGHGYWINVTEPITLYLRPKMPTSVYLPDPPATFYGVVTGDATLNPASGQSVTAWVNGAPCGQGTTQLIEAQVMYMINVSSACAASGQMVTFRVAGYAMGQSAPWDNSAVHELALAPANRLYLPLIVQ